MTPRENAFTFARTEHPWPIIRPGDLVLVQVLNLRSSAAEYLWLDVQEEVHNGLYSALTLHAAELFEALPAHDTVYLRAEHALQVRTPGNPQVTVGWLTA